MLIGGYRNRVMINTILHLNKRHKQLTWMIENKYKTNNLFIEQSSIFKLRCKLLK